MTISVGQVGTNSARVTNGSSLITAAKTTSASGSGFVVVAAASAIAGNSLTYTISDTFGNSYTLLTQRIFSSGGATYFVDRWYVAPGAAGYVGGGAGHTVTVTPTSVPNQDQANIWLALIEMPGAATGNANFYSASASQTYPFSNAGPYASTSLTVAPPAGGAVLVSGFVSDGTSGTGADSTGFATQITGILNTNSGGAIGTRAVTSSATYTPSWLWTPAADEAFTTLDSFFGPASTAAALTSAATETITATGTLGVRHVVADMTLETTTTTGTNPFSLAGAVTGFRSFASVMSDQDTCLYLAQAVTGGAPNGPWEIGIGTYTLSTNSLARTQVLKSSNGNAAVVFAAGTTNVALTEPAEVLWNKGVHNVGNSGSAITIDWVNGPYQMVTLNAATPTITFAHSMLCPHGELELYQDSVGGRVPTITGAVYRSGSPPTWSTTNATHDTLRIHYNAVTGKSNVFAET